MRRNSVRLLSYSSCPPHMETAIILLVLVSKHRPKLNEWRRNSRGSEIIFGCRSVFVNVKFVRTQNYPWHTAHSYVLCALILVYSCVKVKGKVNWAPHNKGVLGSGGTAPRIPDLSTRWRWVVSFTPRERAPGTHLIVGSVGPRADLDKAVKRNIPSLCRDSKPDHPARNPALSRVHTTVLTLFILSYWAVAFI
jgi:hypothetical protein